ncbi:MAG: acyltransferase, partial [Acinetobacter sp.]|nr:acyltransferase [Acinetobacter sp.]
DGIQIGAHAVVGMNSMVTKNVEARAVVVGNPAGFIRYRD